MVQFWKGYPGTGKSRLMLEFAERATKAGCRVLFVEKSVHDLDAALRCIRSTEPVVLLWDDYQGNKPEELQTFLDLRRLPHKPLSPPVKRVITAWPSHNVLGEKARDASYEEHDLRPIAPGKDLISYTRRLKKEMSEADARKIVETAASQPEFVLRAVQLVLTGTPADHLPRNLPEKVYDDLVKRVLPEGLDERKRVSDALVAVALVGVVNMGEPRQRAAFQAAGIENAALGRLVERRTVMRNQEAFSLSLDTFRAHVVRRAVDHQRLDVLSGTPRELAELAAPLLADWFDVIWRICVLAAKDSPLGSEVRAEILSAFDASPISGWSHAAAMDVAMKLNNANIFEPDPNQRMAIADRIGKLREKHDTAEIALVEAVALANVAVGGGDQKDRTELDDQLEDVKLVMKAAEALTTAIADRVGKLREKHHTAEIAFVEAAARADVVVGGDVQKDRTQLDDQLEDVKLMMKAAEAIDSEGHLERVAEIVETATILKARIRATMGTPDPKQRLSLAERIGELRKKYNTAEIARQEARALVNATFFAETAGWSVDMADRIEAIRKEHPTTDIAGFETMALMRAIEVETDARRKEALEQRVAQFGWTISRG
jgi:hypothetical protein